MSDLYTVTYLAYPSGEFTETFRVRDSWDVQSVIDVACRNAELRERARIISSLKDFKTEFGTGWDTVYSEGFAGGIAASIDLIEGENE